MHDGYPVAEQLVTDGVPQDQAPELIARLAPSTPTAATPAPDGGVEIPIDVRSRVFSTRVPPPWWRPNAPLAGTQVEGLVLNPLTLTPVANAGIGERPETAYIVSDLGGAFNVAYGCATPAPGTAPPRSSLISVYNDFRPNQQAHRVAVGASTDAAELPGFVFNWRAPCGIELRVVILD